MESLSPDPEEISLDIGELKENPVVERPYSPDDSDSGSRKALMERVQQVGQKGRHMKDELAQLRAKTSSNQEGDFSERHKQRGELLEIFRQDLAMQREGLSATLTEIFDEIHRDPNQSALDLFEIAARSSETHRFDVNQLSAIADGLLKYEQKHQAIEKAAAEHPDPDEFFTANFGSSPQGKVEVIKGPMTINFRCYDPEDYQVAYAGGRDHLNDENKARSSSSAGFASSGSKIPGLAGTIIVENISANKDNWVNKILDHEVISQEASSFSTSDLQQATIYAPDGAAVLKIADLPPSQDSFQRKITLVKAETDELLIDAIETITIENGRASWVTKISGSSGGEEDVEHYFKGWGIEIGQGHVNIIPIDSLKISYQARELVYDPDLAKPPQSNYITIHEEQHQFNKLFTTYENRIIGREVLYEVLAKQPSPKDYYTDASIYDGVVREVATRLARNRRGDIVDNYARDEIIARYRDGRSVDLILLTLSETEEEVKNSPYGGERVALYDFAAQHASDIQSLPEEIVDIVSLYEKEIVSTLELDTFSVDRLTAEQVEPIVKEVFGPEYQEDLRRWTSSISALEAKAYTREEILALLYQYPAYRWPNLARQMPDKQQTAS